MPFGKTLSAARRAKEFTQEDLAAKLYVTRQAVSRWEQGETTPGIDMMKLISLTLDIPVVQLLDLPDEPACQCCGTPFSVPNMPFGTDENGSETKDYCKWCYENGEFTSIGLDELIEHNVPYLVAGSNMTPDEAVSFLGAVLPTLKHWRAIENKNASGNAKRSKFYACPTCGNIMWSMGDAAISCCGSSLQPLPIQEPDEKHTGTIEIIDGSQVVTMDHPMTKDHYFAFIACVGDDLVRIKRLYPEQESQASFPLQGPAKMYAFCNKHGLFAIK